jgi:hypothetical protein
MIYKGYGIRLSRTIPLGQETKKTTIFIYLAHKHLMLRRFTDSLGASWHNMNGKFQWELTLRSKFPFFSLFTRADYKHAMNNTTINQRQP